MSQVEWKKVRLGDVCSFQEGYVNPSQSFPKYFDGDVKWLRATDLNNGPVYTTSRTLTKEGFESAGKSALLFKPNTIGISKSGTIGRLGILKDYMCGNRAVINIAPNATVDVKFIFYSLLKVQDHFENIAVGSVQKNLYVPILSEMEISLPPLEEQKRIAGILSSLDDKIELNNKINDNLEKQAQALFKNWFIDYAPFGGTMPGDWTLGKLSELCNFQEGYVNPAQTHNEYFDGDVKWLRAVDINESFIIGTSRTLTTAGFESAGKSALLFKPNTIAISKSGTIGRLGIVADYMCGNRAVINIEPHSEKLLPFIHQYLKYRQNEFPDLAVGSVQKNLYVSILEGLDVVIPDEKSMLSFADVLNPIYNQMRILSEENQRLTTLRDTLLPKLMSGE